MYFLYVKSDGSIWNIRRGKPETAVLNKEENCSLGRGVKWDNVDLFYAPDEDFPKDFFRTAPLGKYYVKNEEVEESKDWEEPDED